MQIDFIQTSCTAINSVYIIRNFLDDNTYLNSLCNKIEKLTKKDSMNRSTNVKANMTTYTKLVENVDFNNIHTKILETLGFIYKTRDPHPEGGIDLKMIESWGMKHTKGDYTKMHIHLGFEFAASFILKTPRNVFFNFWDFEQRLEVENNMLILFPGLLKHSVDPCYEDDYRISMACNINIDAI